MNGKETITEVFLWVLQALVSLNLAAFAYKTYEDVTSSSAPRIEDSAQLKEICENAKAFDNSVLVAVKPGERLAYNPDTRQVFWVGDVKTTEKKE